ncbi:hypothetical protein [Rhizobium leguminosarum]|uniref:hypothetical protein n=1 Tax=Rhizobium leguminosarum TaxID=384 RepID=UPI00103E4F54|nr:hypothetical protein [Rhizobium leguminosarum]TBY85069.1 hypothetical protein E0H32_07155 [Rhizobium leguminosarum bv. viciae]TBZ26657.1 hypothetical protein E0H38_02285 [Rhizobium leguminosarum bv. viciae]
MRVGIALLARQEPDERMEIASMIDDDSPCQSFAPIKGRPRLSPSDVELAEMSNKAIAKLADLAPMTNDGDTSIRPLHENAAAGIQASTASSEASAFDLQSSGRRTNRQT